MFNLQEAYSNVSLDDIYSRVSEEDLWKYYCPNFKKVNESFRSEFYKDNNPSCRIFNGNKGLIYKDFGTEESYNILAYIQKKYTCNFKECLSIIANDFNIKASNRLYSPRIISIITPEVLFKTKIDIVPQGYTITDWKYWMQYYIPLEVLESEEVISCKTVYLTTGTGVYRYDYTHVNPIYAFKEYDIDRNFLGYKIYFPLAPKGRRWINSTSDKAVQGIQSLTGQRELILLGKARKDCICYKLLGIDAIAPYNETSNLESNGISKLLTGYDRKFVNYDPDEKGIKESLQINIKYGYSYYFVDEEKDLSDYIKKYGLNKAKEMIWRKING
jgi:hypothetical protein